MNKQIYKFKPIKVVERLLDSALRDLEGIVQNLCNQGIDEFDIGNVEAVKDNS